MNHSNPDWERLKRLVRKRSGGICERCKERKGEHVHHLVYAQRRGREKLEWLQHVCLDCHAHYHPRHTFRSLHEQRQIAKQRAKTRARRAKGLPVSSFRRGWWQDHPDAPTPSLKDREHGMVPKNRRTGKSPLVTPCPAPSAETSNRRADPLAGYDPFTPMTNYRGNAS